MDELDQAPMNQIWMEIKERMIRMETLIETKFEIINDMTKKQEVIGDTAREALSSAREIQRRMAEQAVETEKRIAEVNARINAKEQDTKWLWRAVVGSIIASAIGIVVKLTVT